MIFDVKKEDFRRKARHVVGGHKINSSHVESFSSVTQSMSTRMMLNVAESCELKAMGGDFRNPFPHAPALQKACAVAGEEFGEMMGRIVEVIQSTHVMATVSRSFSLFLGDFIRTLGHLPSRADPDAWMKKDEGCEGCSHMSTHVDDFLIIGKNPEIIMRKFEKKFLIRTQEIDRGTCLGCNVK